MEFWALLITGAVIVGVSKTSVGGLSVLAIFAFALAIPIKESTGSVLLVFLIGDLVAVWRYRHDCNWGLLKRLIPWVIPGVLLGTWFLSLVNGLVLKRSIGVLLIFSVLIHFLLNIKRKTPSKYDCSIIRLIGSGLAGIAAGFTTMTANAGGPVMTLYLLAEKVDKRVFVGTGAWFFFLVNLTKLPFSVFVGATTLEAVKQTIVLIPAVLAGTYLGIKLLKAMGQRLFNNVALVSSVVVALLLVVM